MQLLTSVNKLGAWTLYKKEVRRFLKVYNQTLLAPIINAILLLAIFSLAIGKRIDTIEGVPFHAFMAAGLVMMSVIQQAFANTSSTLIMGKVLGSIIDYLMPPLSSGEIIFSMVMAGVTRGILIGILVGGSVAFFVDMTIHSYLLALFYIILSSVILCLLGILAGIFADSFDQMAAITSYIITPLSFLSGTFYSVKQLPEFWYVFTKYNPFFYMIDGFRYSATGYSDGSIEVGIIYLLSLAIVLWTVCYKLISSGYRIKT